MILLSCNGGGTPGVVANLLDCDITVTEFKLQLCFCIYFWTNRQKEFCKRILSIMVSKLD